MSLPSANVANTNIPLTCNVCPRRPDFSDLSHLLTHVASKGHLSNYYKMKVKASEDASTKAIVDDYDEWYQDWNLEQLMRERMSQKEKKRGGGGGGSNTARKAGPGGRGGDGSASASRNTSTASGRGRPSNRLRDNLYLLDPQLGTRLKREPLSRSATPVSNFSYESNGMGRHPMQHYAFGNMTFGGMSPVFSPPIKQESLGSSNSDDDYEDSYSMRLASARHSRRHRTSASVTSTIDEEDGMANDNSKLKGIFWPGMSMFDSATPEMRRRRNQKKNASVLQSLQATSEVVEPTECVYDATGALRKERTITGLPESEDDLIEGESEPDAEPVEKKPRPYRRRPRVALQEKSVNSGRVLRSQGQSHHPGRSLRNHYTADDDDDLTYGSSRLAKVRTGLSIHRDNTGPDITFDNPVPINYLTTGVRNNSFPTTLQSNNLQPQQPYQYNHVPRGHIRQQSWGQLPGGFRPSTNGNNMQNHGVSNFGQYLNTAQSGHQLDSNTAGNHSFGGFQQHFLMGQQQPLPSANSLFQGAAHTNWDFLGLDNHDSVGLDTGFHASHEMPPIMNPLFFSSTKEDDEATISVKSDQ